MSQLVLNVAYGMNGGKIPKMTNKQLIAAFFTANENLPSIKKDEQSGIRHNMALIADEISDRVDQAKGQNKVRLGVHLMVMATIVKKLYQ